MTALHESNDKAAEARASLILHDLRVLSGRALSLDGKPPFDWLQPGFSNDIHLPTHQRLDAGLVSLPPDAQSLTAQGMLLALSTAAAQWLGAQVTLDLLDWVYESQPELLNSRLLLAFVFHHNAADKAESAFWVREIAQRYGAWGINSASLVSSSSGFSAQDWTDVVLRSTVADRVDVTCWLVGFIKRDATLLAAVHRAALAELRNNLPSKPPGVIDWGEEIERPIAKACGFANTSGASDIDEKLAHRADLQRYVCNAPTDWPAAEQSANDEYAKEAVA